MYPSVIRTILKKLLRALFLVWAALTIAFLALRLLPGSPIQQVLGVSFYNQEVLEELSRGYGLAEPVQIQYAGFIKAFMSGDLGKSIRSGRGVGEEAWVRLGNSAKIAIPAILISVVLSLVVSLWYMMHPSQHLSRAAKQLIVLGSSVPPFLVGIIVMLCAGLLFRVGVGSSAIGFNDFALAVISLVVILGTYLIRQMVLLFEEETERAFVVAMISRGIGRKSILIKHVMRNALAPVLSVVGLVAGYLIVGTIIVEVIFGIPGIGRLFYEGLMFRDYPVVQFVILASVTAFAGVNFLVDVAQIINDPRLRV